MEIPDNTKKLISEAKNICLVPSENEPESLTASLALFYTLRELGKNVNLISDNLPEKLNFLVPTVDFISSPKNFVISIPKSIADVSQVYYEKTDENLKIHLTTEKGNIKKENISFYFHDAKPDLIVTIGIRDFKKYMEDKLDSFGFLLGSPILSIDNDPTNLQFGQINLVEQKSLSEIILGLIKLTDEKIINKNVATCLLSGLIIYYDNFKSKKINDGVFQTAAELIKRGADYQQINDNLYKATQKEINFLSNVFENLKTDRELSFAILDSADPENFSESEIRFAVEKIMGLGIQNDLLVLWDSHNSKPLVRGFFYSKKPHLINKVAQINGNQIKNDWVLLAIPEENINSVKEKILKLL
ncbi:MAG: hypothetical protein AAB340_03125 [Patescibacteria group bacterium]